MQTYPKQLQQVLMTGDKPSKFSDFLKEMHEAEHGIPKKLKLILESQVQILDYNVQNILEAAPPRLTSTQLLNNLQQIAHLRRVISQHSEQLQRIIQDL